ncbi:hypothetical protein [Chondromyces crocatus]|nr:hypothetical protein [Chondromyces crocatus]
MSHPPSGSRSSRFTDNCTVTALVVDRETEMNEARTEHGCGAA